MRCWSLVTRHIYSRTRRYTERTSLCSSTIGDADNAAGVGAPRMLHLLYISVETIEPPSSCDPVGTLYSFIATLRMLYKLSCFLVTSMQVGKPLSFPPLGDRYFISVEMTKKIADSLMYHYFNFNELF